VGETISDFFAAWSISSDSPTRSTRQLLVLRSVGTLDASKYIAETREKGIPISDEPTSINESAARL